MIRFYVFCDNYNINFLLWQDIVQSTACDLNVPHGSALIHFYFQKEVTHHCVGFCGLGQGDDGAGGVISYLELQQAVWLPDAGAGQLPGEGAVPGN